MVVMSSGRHIGCKNFDCIYGAFQATAGVISAGNRSIWADGVIILTSLY